MIFAYLSQFLRVFRVAFPIVSLSKPLGICALVPETPKGLGDGGHANGRKTVLKEDREGGAVRNHQRVGADTIPIGERWCLDGWNTRKNTGCLECMLFFFGMTGYTGWFVCDSVAGLDLFGLTWGNQTSGLTKANTNLTKTADEGEEQNETIHGKTPPEGVATCCTQHSAVAHSLWGVKAQLIPGFSLWKKKQLCLLNRYHMPHSLLDFKTPRIENACVVPDVISFPLRPCWLITRKGSPSFTIHRGSRLTAWHARARQSGYTFLHSLTIWRMVPPTPVEEIAFLPGIAWGKLTKKRWYFIENCVSCTFPDCKTPKKAKEKEHHEIWHKNHLSMTGCSDPFRSTFCTYSATRPEFWLWFIPAPTAFKS